MHPEPLHGGGFLHSFRGGQQDALNDTAEVARVEQVVGLGGRGQQLLHGLLVHVQRSLHDLVNAGLELVTEASVTRHTLCEIIALICII